jgi:hypothetical protein
MPAPVSVDAAPTIVGGLNQHERFGRSQFCNPMITLSGFTGAVDKSGDFLSQVARLHERCERLRRRHWQAAGLALTQHGDRLLSSRQVGARRAVRP